MTLIDDSCADPQIAIVGRGRLGTALAAALSSPAPFGRGFDGAGFDVVLLAVPDREIANAVSAIVDGPLLGHCSGATDLDVFGGREGFSLHPLMTVTGAGSSLTGAGAAIDGNSDRALACARSLARTLNMHPFQVAAVDRAAYHAAASVASNFLVTLLAAASELAESAGVERGLLAPLVRASVENWVLMGAGALTGPVARGDRETVAKQRAVVAERTPQSLALFDAMVAATATLAEATVAA